MQTLQILIKILCIVFICGVVDGYLRMGYPHVGLIYLPELLDKPFRNTIGALLVMPFIVFVYYIWFYIPMVVLYALVAKDFVKTQKRIAPYVVSSAILGSLWYVIVASNMNELSRPYVYYMVFMYGVVGAVYGFLYHRWIVKPFLANGH